MNLNKITSNTYNLTLQVNDNSYRSHFEFIINTNDQRVPTGKTIIDLFSTGQIYMNLPKDKVLSNGSDNLRTIFSSYYHDPLTYNGFNLAKKSSDTIPTWAELYSVDNFDGWILDTKLFFDLQDNYLGMPICKNFTGHIQSGSFYQSQEYAFANLPPFAVCSSSKVAITKTTAAPCAYSYNQYKCPFYESRYDLLQSNSIKTYGSDDLTIYELRVSPCISGDAIYQIVQVDTNNITYSINVELRSDETDTEAKEVFQQVMETYKDGFTSLSQVNNMSSSVEKNSYILSLV
jgi:predicted DNA-binding protein YlxM (UPF0122 family)